MDKNEPLAYRDAMMRITKRIPDRVKYKALCKKKQRIFQELHELSGDQYRNKLKEIRCQ